MYAKKNSIPADLAEITLMSPGDILVLYTDGVYDGSDQQGRASNLRRSCANATGNPPKKSATPCWITRRSRMIFFASSGDAALIDDKTVFIVKRT